MNPAVLRRFIILLAILTVVLVIGSSALDGFFSRPPGDLETETGTLRLEDGRYAQALIQYDKALQLSPNHRGALMGRALVFLNTGKYQQAVSELDDLINYLRANLPVDDRTGQAALAAAFANKGIALDRLGQYQKAFDAYVQSLKTDPETVAGPGTIHKILYGSERVSTVRERAIYLYKQLQLPPEKRLMRIPELDNKQRMYQP